MKSVTVALALIGAGLIAWGSSALAAPETSEVAKTWQFEIQLDKLATIKVKVPGELGEQTFWYLRYIVTNHTGEDRLFVPRFALYTNTGELLSGEAGVPVSVFKEIQKVHNDPLLRNTTGMTGKLLQGEDNAQRGVVIFRDFDHQAGQVDIFIGGLSGDNEKVKLPKAVSVIEPTDDGKLMAVQRDTVMMTRTLWLRYDLSGDLNRRANMVAKLTKSSWVMR